MDETENNLKVLEAVLRRAIDIPDSLVKLNPKLAKDQGQIVEVMDRYYEMRTKFETILNEGIFLIHKHGKDLQQQQEREYNDDSLNQLVTVGITLRIVLELLNSGSDSFIEMKALLEHGALQELLGQSK